MYDTTLQKSSSFTVGASVTSYTVGSGVLTAGDTFVWNVRALNGSVSGPPSVYLYFHTPASVTLAAPVAVSPGTTASPGPLLTTATPTFVWQSVTGATGYQINVYDTTLQKSSSFTVGASVTSYTVAAGVLTAGDTFVWNVRALNGSVSGPPSVYLYFHTPASVTLAAPVALSPGSTTSPGPFVTTTTPKFAWQGVSNATGYQVNVYDQTLKKAFTFTVGASATSYTVSAGVLTAGDSFVWNVRALNGSVSGPPSAYLFFRIIV